VLIKEKLDEIGARLEHTLQKPLSIFAQETSISKAAAATAAELSDLGHTGRL
jgi:hypothetical protein